MAGYFNIDENKKGKLAISKDIIYHLVEDSIRENKNISKSKSGELEKGEYARISAPTVITTKNGITDIKVYVAVNKHKNIQKAASEISKQLTSDLTISLGHMPINVRVKVEELI